MGSLNTIGQSPSFPFASCRREARSFLRPGLARWVGRESSAQPVGEATAPVADLLGGADPAVPALSQLSPVWLHLSEIVVEPAQGAVLRDIRPILDLVQRLRGVVLEGLGTFIFADSGAEAVEAALKLAHCVSGRRPWAPKRASRDVSIAD